MVLIKSSNDSSYLLTDSYTDIPDITATVPRDNKYSISGKINILVRDTTGPVASVQCKLAINGNIIPASGGQVRTQTVSGAEFILAVDFDNTFYLKKGDTITVMAKQGASTYECSVYATDNSSSSYIEVKQD